MVPKGYRIVTEGNIKKGDFVHVFRDWQPAKGAVGEPAGRGTWKGAVCRKETKKENRETLLKKEALEFIMLRLSGTYVKESHIYKTVEKALDKLSQEELAALSAMVLTVT